MVLGQNNRAYRNYSLFCLQAEERPSSPSASQGMFHGGSLLNGRTGLADAT